MNEELRDLKREREDYEESAEPVQKQMTKEGDIRRAGTESQDKLSKSSRRRARQKENKLKALEIICSLPPLCSEDPQTFANSSLYEAHYKACHVNICSECKRNFPTSKLLNCHITENHDPFAKIKLGKGEPIFGCFVADCERFFKDHKKRRLHLIDKHHYPKDYIYSVVDRGIKKGDVTLIKASKSYNVWKPA